MEMCCLEQSLPSTEILFSFSLEGKMEIGGENSVPSSSLQLWPREFSFALQQVLNKLL